MAGSVTRPFVQADRLALLAAVQQNVGIVDWRFSSSIVWVGPHKNGRPFDIAVLTAPYRDRFGTRPISLGLHDDIADAEARAVIEEWVQSLGFSFEYGSADEAIKEEGGFAIRQVCTLRRNGVYGTGYGPTRSWAIVECVLALSGNKKTIVADVSDSGARLHG